MGGGKTYPLLSQTTGTLVLGVSEQFNDALLVGGKTVRHENVSNLLHKQSRNLVLD